MRQESNFEARIKKALNATNSGATLEQEFVDPIIGEIVDFENALRQNLMRRPGSGQAAIINRRVPGTTVAAFVADTDVSFNHSDGTYTQVTFPYKTILARGAISRRLQATGRSYIDIKSNEIESRAKDYRNFEDDAILTSAVSSIAYDGAQVLITNIVGMSDTTNAGAALTLLKLDEAIDTANGPIDMMIMSRRTRRELFALLLGNIDTTVVEGGFKLSAYSDIPIFISTNVPDTERYDETVPDVSNNVSGATSEILLLNRSEFWIDELTPLSFADVNPQSTNVENFEIFSDHAPAHRDTLSCVRLVGIAAT